MSVPYWLLREARATMAALRLDADALHALAARRLAALLADAERHVPACVAPIARARAAAAAADPFAVLAALAPVTKPELRAQGPSALRGGRLEAAWRASASSGSTGEPFRVAYDPRAWAVLKVLVKLRARVACGVRPTDRVAILDAIPVTDEGRLPLERLGRLRRISVLQPAERVAEALAAFRPQAIYGLPSALLEVAPALARLGGVPGARGLFTSGELLEVRTRRALEAAYGAPVFDVYGTSETKEIAWECRAGGRHVNADVVHVEVLDEAGRVLPPGEEGDLVVTSLLNRAMPLLRYRTGDRGALQAGRCTCGLAFPLLGVVTGRRADVLEFEGGLRVSPYALTCALERVEPLERYQVVQLDRATLRVRARVPASADREATGARIRAALRSEVSPLLQVEVEYVDRFATGARAKFRVVEPLSR
ncbi:MAG TPA: AMP-binding protein [Gemmatimonadales bacterium]|nr:AMP-binding protein [Gemmatimonadales bacterium]